SPQPILDACNAVISDSRNLSKKTLWSKDRKGRKPSLTIVANDAVQNRLVVERIRRMCEQGVPLREQAVLARTAKDLDSLASELRKRRIPYRRTGGGGLFQRHGSEAVLALLNWAENPADTTNVARAIGMISGKTSAEAFRIIRSSARGEKMKRPKSNAPGDVRAKIARLVERLRALP